MKYQCYFRQEISKVKTRVVAHIQQVSNTLVIKFPMRACLGYTLTVIERHLSFLENSDRFPLCITVFQAPELMKSQTAPVKTEYLRNLSN